MLCHWQLPKLLQPFKNESFVSSIYHKRCTCSKSDDDLDIGAPKSAHSRRRRRQRDPNKSKLEIRLDKVKEEVIEDLIRILGGGGQKSSVEINHVANYFLASKLIANLQQLRKEASNDIQKKVGFLFFSLNKTKICCSRSSLFCILRLRIQRKMNQSFFAN